MNDLLRFFTIFVFVSLCHAALAAEKMTAENEEKFLLLEFDDEVFCKKAKDIVEERLLAKDGSLNNLMDWKYHEWFDTDNHGQKKQIYHGEYIYVDYDGDGHQEMLVRRRSVMGGNMWFHGFEIFDAEKFNAETTEIDPKNYWHHMRLQIDQVRSINRNNSVGSRYINRSWIDAMWIEKKLYFIFIQTYDSSMVSGTGSYDKSYKRPNLLVFSIDTPNEKYKTSTSVRHDIWSHCFIKPKNQIQAKYK